ncbi:BgTH12-04120 [Blumeria graminis f. sp. triticale]|uniref:Bgt-2874-2 n=3 Tax=Blumeria graminis TaxID=34373 RepID=A0A061HLF1_BLUGR|nr:hypothetical protein BGT96224_2874B [Blumeria graminis f. sp. tritici 96224]CAD6500015.1 BgTH12-04120 [Blumeria graminis f. sp. triticale]VCU40195.1 Bgt-2874-2 [Blumeria graminis f. sp. tritici]
MTYCDVSVLFEGSYSAHKMKGLPKAISAFQCAAQVGREAIACIIHNLPDHLLTAEDMALMEDLRYAFSRYYA